MAFQDQIVFITGAASGLGEDLSLAFAAAGARVALADRNAAGLQALAARIRAQGGQCLELLVDVAQESQVEAAFAQLQEHWAPPQVVINNAGIGGPRQPLHQYTAEAWEKVQAVNQLGVFFCLREAIKAMLGAQQGGVIINIASLAGLKGLPLSSAYTASKHAVVGMTRAAALEYARANIRVNAVCPGFTQTPLLDELFSTNAALADKLEKQIPLQRYSTPADVTNAVLWLAQPQSAFITGIVLPVDGGLMA